MDKQPVGQLPDLTQSNNDDEIMVITNDEYNQLKKEKISDFITDLTSTDADNSLVKGDDGKLFVSKTINASDVNGVLSLDNIPQLTENKLPETGISADNYSYPSSITVNDRGQVVSIVEGSAAEAGAYLDQSQITNCLLSISQLVPQPVVADNTLTFSQGLTVIVPYGKSAPTLEVGGSLNGGEIVDISWDGQSLFYIVKYGAKTYTKNKTTGSDEYVLMNAAGALSGLPFDFAFSSATEPEVTEPHAIWYDSANNIVKWSADTGASWANYYSLPVAAISFSGSGTSYDISGVKTLYNGTKFIDSALFIDKGIKILIPSGRNPDGTLKNTEYEFTNVGVYDMTDDIAGDYWVQAGVNNFVGRLQKTWWNYNPLLNNIVANDGQIAETATIGEFTALNGRITSFTPYGAYHAPGYDEVVKRDGDTMTGTLKLVNADRPQITMKNPSLTLFDTPTSDVYFGQLLFVDNTGDWVGAFQCQQGLVNSNYITNIVCRRKIGQEEYNCDAGLSILQDGTTIFYHSVDRIQGPAGDIIYGVTGSYHNGTSGWIKYANGLLLQWGYTTNIISTITLYQSYSNAQYHISLTYTASGNQGSKCKTPTALSRTASNFSVGYLDYGSVTVVTGLYWYTIGF